VPAPAADAGRPTVHWLTTSRHVAAGQLSAAAWRVLGSGPVLAAGEHPQAAALAAEGITVEHGDPAVVAHRTGSCTWLADPGISDPAAGPDTADTAGTAVRVGTAGTAVRVGTAGTAVRVGTGGTADTAVRAALAADPSVEVVELVGARDLPGAALLDAVAVMDRLRSPGGCPWDAEQTHASLAPYLIEETYEAYQAIEDGAIDTDLREELGDVLLQVLFHSRLAQERPEPWSVDDVAAGLVAKLVGRHPHVFAGAAAADAAAVEANWEAIKRLEKGRTSVVDGVALGQPALSLAAKLLGRAQKAGLPTTLGELPADVGSTVSAEELVGRALFGIAGRARQQGVDPEAALRAVARAYAAALRRAESDTAAG
jgi:XTP/dITP diphosphohydrolase